MNNTEKYGHNIWKTDLYQSNVPGVLLIAAVVLARTGVTTGGGIPAAISKRG